MTPARLSAARRLLGRRELSRGQGLVELAVVVPAFMLILLGLLEFGFAFNHNLTLEYATREGARAGAAMADGSVKDASCGSGPLTGPNVDPLIIAAVQRVLESPGSMVHLADIQQVTIFEVTFSGTITGAQNVWTYRPGNSSNPAVPCQTPTQLLDFYESSHGWNTNSTARQGGTSPDSVGVGITYTYRFQTPLGGIMRLLFGSSWGTISMTDKTIMALEPTS